MAHPSDGEIGRRDFHSGVNSHSGVKTVVIIGGGIIAGACIRHLGPISRNTGSLRRWVTSCDACPTDGLEIRGSRRD